MSHQQADVLPLQCAEGIILNYGMQYREIANLLHILKSAIQTKV